MQPLARGSYDVAMPISGVADGRAKKTGDTLYLLSAGGRVLASLDGEHPLPRDADFFTAYNTDRAEVAALFRALESGESGYYLMQCGKQPVLILGAAYKANGSLLAILPEPAIAALLTSAAQYDGVLFDKLRFSPFSAAARSAQDEVAYGKIQGWMLPFMRAIARDGMRNEEAAAFMQLLIARTVRFSYILGVAAEYDFLGVGCTTVRNIDYALLTAYLLAAMFTASRFGVEKRLYLALERPPLEQPILYMQLVSEARLDTLELFDSLRFAATLRGSLFEIFEDATRQGLWHMRFSFCQEEIERQELRNPFLENRGTGY